MVPRVQEVDLVTWRVLLAIYAVSLALIVAFFDGAGRSSAVDLVVHGPNEQCARGPVHEAPCMYVPPRDDPSVDVSREPAWGNSLHSNNR